MIDALTIPIGAVHLETAYVVECWRPDRRARDGYRLVWRDAFHNLITTAGKNKILDATFKTGEAANAWYVGLVDNASFSAYAASDTMAVHPGWIEATGYSEGGRQAYVMGAIAAGSGGNSASKAVFTINVGATIRGGFLVDDVTKGGATNTLYGVGDFTAARIVQAADLLRVQATLTAT